MKNKISSQFMFYFNMIFYGIIQGSLCFLSATIKNSLNNAWMIPLIMIIPFFIIIILTPKNVDSLRSLKNRYYFKIILMLYSLLSTILILAFSSKVLNYWFYKKTSIIVFIISGGIITVLLSNFSSTSLIRIGFFGIISYIIIVAFGIGTRVNINPLLLLPLTSPHQGILTNLFLLLIPLDNLIYFFIEHPENDPPLKKTILISGFISLLICSIFIANSLMIVNYRYYIDLDFPILEQFFLRSAKEYVGHYDIILLVGVLITLFYKGSLYINIAFQSFTKKQKIYLFPLVSLLLITGSLFLIQKRFSEQLIYNLILSLMMISLLLFIIKTQLNRRKADEHH